MSAFFILSARSFVLEWQTVTVAFLLKEHHGHGLADDIRPADHDRVLAGEVDACGFDEAHDSVGRAGLEHRVSYHEPADIVRVEAVDIL